jgi:hypothetical protein
MQMDWDTLDWMFRYVDTEPFAGHLVEQKVLQHFTESDRLSFFDTLHDWFHRVTEATGTIDRFFSIGGYTVRLSFATQNMADKLTKAISHLEVLPTEQPSLTIYLWDNVSTETRLPGLLPAFMRVFHWYWYEYLDPRQNVKPLCSDRFQMHFKVGPNIFSALDRKRNIGLYWIADAEGLPYWERGSPLQTLLNWWTSSQNRQYVHAAAVGTSNGGVLLTAKGGSGKSTSALACVNSDLSYASDDYCLVATDPIPYVYSLYNTAKLKGAKDLERFPELAPLVSNGDRLDEEKALIFLKEHFPNKIVTGFPLKAILVPKITGELDTRISKATPILALKSLAPSTLFQLSGTGQSALEMMSSLVKQIPCYTLELGTDITQIPQVILEFLDQSKEIN